jgi:hypothetical protein
MRQQSKHLKYDRTAARHHAQMLAFSMETCGGMAPDAETLMHIVADAGEEHLGLWPKAAVQRGNAMSFLAGHARAMALGAMGGASPEGGE